ncbi:uncharacterized protein LOC129232110 [Uloborus diversus]|uniref:uncharacterized protein LOC129232110 n=1 Tax=Uloborus diversus TaxID=327109 RepID=UPI002409C9A1|nr:uncharacterized protein LOC129232110 [Uloborus diversus]
MKFLHAKMMLRGLLCINVDLYDLKSLKKLVHKRYVQWHPDKNVENPEKYRENFMALNESWKAYCAEKRKDVPSTSQADSEPSDFEWESEDEEGESYNNTPFDDEFFSSSPPKTTLEFPEFIKAFFRSSSNRRAGKLFVLVTETIAQEECEKVYNYNNKTEYFGAFNFKNFTFILIFYQAEWRLVDLKKALRLLKIDFLIQYCVKFNQLLETIVIKCGEPFYEPSTAKRTAKNEAVLSFDHSLLLQYAHETQTEDVLDLVADYLHFATPCNTPQELVTKEHEDFHLRHEANAKLFLKLGDRERAAKNAVKTVQAELKRNLRCKTNLDYLNDRCRAIGDAILEKDDENLFGEAFLYSFFIIPKNKFKSICQAILDAFIYGKPKCRWVGLVGEYGSGKTTFASTITELFEGVSINLNVPVGRVAFYIGAAIGKRFILFDDVKGKKSAQELNLTPGEGFNNLDDLREHLDGRNPVQLEKKNCNPVSQIFPAGLVTCNKYAIPPALKERISFFNFTPSPMYKTHEIEVSMETMFVAMVLHDMLPVEQMVRSHIFSKRDRWLAKHVASCDCMKKFSRSKTPSPRKSPLKASPTSPLSRRSPRKSPIKASPGTP